MSGAVVSRSWPSLSSESLLFFFGSSSGDDLNTATASLKFVIVS